MTEPSRETQPRSNVHAGSHHQVAGDTEPNYAGDAWNTNQDTSAHQVLGQTRQDLT